jgi:hypothetical protein
MDAETLDTLVHLRIEPTVELIDGYDRSKNPRKLKFRRLNMDDIKAISHGNEFWFQSLVNTHPGLAKRCRGLVRMRAYGHGGNVGTAFGSGGVKEQ